jgi:hypothetical protein
MPAAASAVKSRHCANLQWSMILSENRPPLFRIMHISVEHDLVGKPATTFPDHAYFSGA